VNTEAVARIVVHEAFDLHRPFGPGLLEGAYETLLEIRLLGKGLRVDRQKHFNPDFEGIVMPDAYRVDLFVEQCLAPVHFKQVLTYLKVLNLPLCQIPSSHTRHTYVPRRTISKSYTV